MNDFSGLKEVNSHSNVINGVVYSDIPDYTVYVESESDLSLLTDYPIGTIAIQYGFVNMWQKSSDGTWIAVNN